MNKVERLPLLTIVHKIQDFKKEISFLRDILVEEADLERLESIEQRVEKLDMIMQRHYGKNSN